MRELLIGSRLEQWLDVEPQGTQLPAVCAVLCGVKPAADLWITQELLPQFSSLAVQWGLRFHVDPYFDRFDEKAIRASNARFGTTRAALSSTGSSRAEAHIFIAKSDRSLRAAVAAGWYPLVIDGSVVEKSVADHVRFGRALGYPECCISFFRRRNHWLYDNTLYAAYLNTRKRANLLSNGLSRNTAFALISHMPCSFACSESIKQAEAVLGLIRIEAPAYSEHIVARLRLPVLALSELRLFAFRGMLVDSNRVAYHEVEPLNPTSHSDSLLKLLREGTECIVERNVLTIERQGVAIGCYLARGDQYGPECPFIIEAN